MNHTLEMIEVGRKHDVDIAFDVIPHDWNHTLMAAILPKWAQAGSIDDVLERLANPELRNKINETGGYDKDIEAGLTKVVEDFKANGVY